MSRSLQFRALSSLFALLALGTMTGAPMALMARHPGTLICHHASAHHTMQMWVDDAALDGHLSHGDNFGACPVPGDGGGGTLT